MDLGLPDRKPVSFLETIWQKNDPQNHQGSWNCHPQLGESNKQQMYGCMLSDLSSRKMHDFLGLVSKQINVHP